MNTNVYVESEISQKFGCRGSGSIWFQPYESHCVNSEHIYLSSPHWGCLAQPKIEIEILVGILNRGIVSHNIFSLCISTLIERRKKGICFVSECHIFYLSFVLDLCIGQVHV